MMRWSPDRRRPGSPLATLPNQTNRVNVGKSAATRIIGGVGLYARQDPNPASAYTNRVPAGISPAPGGISMAEALRVARGGDNREPRPRELRGDAAAYRWYGAAGFLVV